MLVAALGCVGNVGETFANLDATDRGMSNLATTQPVLETQRENGADPRTNHGVFGWSVEHRRSFLLHQWRGLAPAVLLRASRSLDLLHQVEIDDALLDQVLEQTGESGELAANSRPLEAKATCGFFLNYSPAPNDYDRGSDRLQFVARGDFDSLGELAHIAAVGQAGALRVEGLQPDFFGGHGCEDGHGAPRVHPLESLSRSDAGFAPRTLGSREQMWGSSGSASVHQPLDVVLVRGSGHEASRYSPERGEGVAVSLLSADRALFEEAAPELDALFERAAEGLLATLVKRADDLRWSYLDRPDVDYCMLLARSETTGEALGLADATRGSFGGEACGLIAEWIVDPHKAGRASAAPLDRLQGFARSRGILRLVAVRSERGRHFTWFQQAGFRVAPSPYYLVGRCYTWVFDVDWLYEHWDYSLGDFDLC